MGVENNSYTIVDVFGVGNPNVCVIALDRDFDIVASTPRGVATINGKECSFHLNSVLRWAAIEGGYGDYGQFDFVRYDK